MVIRHVLVSLAFLTLAGIPAEAGRLPGQTSTIGSNRFFDPEDRGYFRIANLLEEDLFLFAEPSFSSKVVMPIEEGGIVASDGSTQWGGFLTWRKIVVGTTVGWIPERQVIRAWPKLIARTSVPLAGACRGYAPVWTASWNDNLMRLSLFPGRAEIAIAKVIVSGEGAISLLTGHSGGLSADLIHTGEFCAPVDGGPEFGTAGILIVTDPQGKRLLPGCCQAEAGAF